MSSQRLFVTAAALLLGAALGFPPAARAAAYLKLGDIKGEVVEANHLDWSSAEAVSLRVSRQAVTDAAGTSTRTTSEFVVSKALDRGSPTLLERLATGKPLPLVEVHLTRIAADGSRQVYLKYELKNVLISSYSVGADGDSTTTPMEQLSLNYEEIKVVYVRLDPRTGRPVEEIPGTIRVDPIKQ